mmetsp:Transcript_37616/g.85405  ORF Transcript_37616/g.85405 Transcript_37616/m.85405 type:complete len:520 (-) Transcript_37616:720-2279(-)
MLLAMFALAQGLDNGVGLTPAMGWSSWNRFRCDINEALIKEVAQAIVSTGLRDVGFQYVNIDDCWMEKRDASGHIVPFASKFPSGMKILADYIHSLGLKFGLYSDTGNTTCEGHPGSFGYEYLDAADYASWGVDYLKYDFCGMDQSTLPPQYYYTVMRDALNETGRPILYSLCSWGTGSPYLWGREVANSWRTGRDVFAVWDEPTARGLMHLPSFLQSVTTAVEDMASHTEYAGPGGFNDPDMLVVGLEGMNPYGIVQECPPHLSAESCSPGQYIAREVWGQVGGLTYTEQRTQFSWWCMLAAPLILGNDPRSMSRAALRILTATELTAINQDPLGIQAQRVWVGGTLSIWKKELADGTVAVMLLNSGAFPADITLRYNRDIPEIASKWWRLVPREPPCEDRHDAIECNGWAQDGECASNPGYMKGVCPKSCGACPTPLWEGRQATALVRDVWEREYLGIFTAMFTAKNVEAHEARVISLKFEEPVSVCIICSERSHTGWQSLANNPFRTTVSHCLSPA